MLLFVVGLPGGFTDWCAAIAARYLERMVGAADRISANSLTELAYGLIRHGTANGIVHATSPNGPLRAALVESGRPFVVALGDPRRAIADLTADQSFGFPQVLRQVASSCAAISSLDAASGGHVLVLRSEMPGYETAFAIGAHFCAGLDEATLTTIATEAPAAFDETDTDIEAWWHGLAPELREAAEGALGAYLTDEPEQGKVPIVWGPELFCLGDNPDQPATGAIDITGLPRCLFEGPDILLAPGAWFLSVAASFSPTAIEHEYLVEVLGCDPPLQHVIRPPQNGHFEGAAELTVPETGEMPLKVQLSTVRAAFDGTVRLIGAKLRRPN